MPAWSIRVRTTNFTWWYKRIYDEFLALHPFALFSISLPVPPSCLSIFCYSTQHGQGKILQLQLHFPLRPLYLSITFLANLHFLLSLSLSLLHSLLFPSFSLSDAHHGSPESLQSISVWEAFIFRATSAKWERNAEMEGGKVHVELEILNLNSSEREGEDGDKRTERLESREMWWISQRRRRKDHKISCGTACCCFHRQPPRT